MRLYKFELGEREGSLRIGRCQRFEAFRRLLSELGDLQLLLCFGQFVRQEAHVQLGQELSRLDRIPRPDVKTIEAPGDAEGEIFSPPRESTSPSKVTLSTISPRSTGWTALRSGTGAGVGVGVTKTSPGNRSQAPGSADRRSSHPTVVYQDLCIVGFFNCKGMWRSVNDARVLQGHRPRRNLLDVGAGALFDLFRAYLAPLLRGQLCRATELKDRLAFLAVQR